MSSMSLNARLDTYHHRPLYPLRVAGAVAEGLTDIHNATFKCLFVVNRSRIYVSAHVKNPEESNLAGVEVM
jgi:hypothetical protein